MYIFSTIKWKKIENNLRVNVPCSPLQEQSFCISCNSHYSFMHGSRKQGKVQYLTGRETINNWLHVLQHAIKEHLALFSEMISHRKLNKKPMRKITISCYQIFFNMQSGEGVIRLMFKRYDHISWDSVLVAADKN